MDNKCIKCGKYLVEMKPDYLPLGTDVVVEIVDYTCPDCGGVYVGVNGGNVRQTIQNQKLHDKLIGALLDK